MIAIARCHLSTATSPSRNAHFPRYHLLKSITAFASSALQFVRSFLCRLSVQTTLHSRTYQVFVFVSSFDAYLLLSEPERIILHSASLSILGELPKRHFRIQPSIRVPPDSLGHFNHLILIPFSVFIRALPPPPSDRFEVRPRR